MVELSASLSGRLSPGTYWMAGGVAFRTDVDSDEKKSWFRRLESNPGYQLLACHFTDLYVTYF
jgi:hypothetical protein